MALFDGCVAAWKLSDLIDATGRGNTLTNNNSVAFVAGKIGNAAEFVTASSKFLSKASSADVDRGHTEWSLGFWYKPASTTSIQVLIGMQDDVNGGGFSIRTAAGGNGLTFTTLTSGGSASGSVSVTPAFVAGNWYSIVVRHSPTDGLLYLNVNDTASSGSGGLTGTTGSCAAQFRIGARAYPGFQEYTDGLIDAVHIWSRKLSNAEVTEFHNSGTGIEFTGGGAPIADAGLDQVRMEFETVMLDSSQSIDPESITSRLWEQVSGTTVTINNPTSVNPTFTAPDVASPADLVFKVTIEDEDENTAEDQVTITVVPTGSTTWLWHTPQEEGLDPDEFYAALVHLPSPSMVIRNGRVLATKGDVTLEGLTWSASKSLCALIFGRQLQLTNVDYTDTVPGSDNPSAPLATFAQMMAMVSDYGLTPHSPGDHYAYNNAGVHHYATHLKETFYAGNTHVQTLQNALALDFEDTLGYDTGGFMSGWGGGWSMSTRDLARVCQLVLQNGVWEGVQIVDPDFITALYTCQIPNAAIQTPDTAATDFFDETILTVHLHGAYSFGFWLAQNHDFIGAPSMNEAISMIGAFGTTAHISRAKQLIVVACNVGGTTVNNATVAIPPSVFDLFADALPEQRASSRLTRGSLHGFYDDEALNRTEFWEVAEADHELAPNGSPHSHTAANVALTQTHVLTVQDGIHGHAAQPLALELPARGSGRVHRGASFEYFDDEGLNRTEFWELSTISSLTVQDAEHSHTAGGSVLTQAHSLTVQDAAHGHTAQNVTLTQTHVLTAQSSSHAHTAENPALTQVHGLTVGDATHAHSSDNTVLTQAHGLVVQSATHAHSSDSLLLTQIHALVVDPAAHVHAADGLLLGVEGDLVVADSVHVHTSESPALTQVHVLTVANAVHAHSAESFALPQAHGLVVANASHVHTTESLTITQTHQIAVADALHDHAVDSLALVQVHVLAVNPASHAHSVENVGISSSDALGIQDATHGHSAEVPTLTQAHNLVASSSLHTHTATDASLTQAHSLTVASGEHGHSAGSITLSVVHNLSIQSASHAQVTDGLVLAQIHTLTIQAGNHGHTASNVILVAEAISTPPRRTFIVQSTQRVTTVRRDLGQYLIAEENRRTNA